MFETGHCYTRGDDSDLYVLSVINNEFVFVIDYSVHHQVSHLACYTVSQLQEFGYVKDEYDWSYLIDFNQLLTFPT